MKRVANAVVGLTATLVFAGAVASVAFGIPHLRTIGGRAFAIFWIIGSAWLAVHGAKATMRVWRDERGA